MTRVIALLGLSLFALLSPQREGLFNQIQASTNIEWLERLVSDESTADSLTPDSFGVDITRRMAYVRLGVIGTEEAIAAIRRIEEAARRTPMLAESMPTGRWPHPAPHVSGFPYQTIVSASAGERTYGIVHASLLGSVDFFLVTRRGDGWTRPKLIDGQSVLRVEGPDLTPGAPGQLTLTFTSRDEGPFRMPRQPQPPFVQGPQSRTIDVGTVERDADADGWTDLEEVRLGLDPRNRDTDGDGLHDGVDNCPNHAESATDGKDDEAIVLKKAAFVIYGLNRSRAAVFVGKEIRRAQLWGFRGPVIYGIDRDRWMSEYQHGFVFANWSAVVSGDTATVTLGDYEAPMSAATYLVQLKRIGGEWVVVSQRMTSIS